ncbi:hypothetical protein SESBI_07944 [Sesbania bispinosa]|nr:hypothetical protein SESBI_07944 [Sesbania bispinosa]
MSKDVRSSDVHDISDDEKRGDNTVEVFQKFLCSTPDVRSLWDSRFEFGNMIDIECSLKGDVKQLEKWGPWSAHVMLQVQGIRSAILGLYLELESVRGASDVEVLRKKIVYLKKDLNGYEELRVKVAGFEGQEKADHDVTKQKLKADRDHFIVEVSDSYDSGFNQALEQMKILYPEVDISVRDVLKEVVGRVLVDLIVGEIGDENVAAEKQDDAVPDSLSEKVDAEDEGIQTEMVNEDLGNAPCN